LSQSGNGTVVLDVESNLDQNFGGCTTGTRTGSVTVNEADTSRTAKLTLVQQGSQMPFQPAESCQVSSLPYGSTVSGSLGSRDCTVGAAPARYYTFQGFSGQQIQLQLTAGRFVSGGLQTPAETLYGPGSGVVVSAGANVVVDAPIISRTLSCAGTFTLAVTSSISSVFNPSGTGNFTLRLDSFN
jgi:hypothetical protein